MNMFISFLNCESGATSIEYAIMASCIAVAIVAAVLNLSTTVNGSYTLVSIAMK